MKRDFLTTSEELSDRKFTFNLSAVPRTSRSIQEELDEKEQLLSER